MCCQSEAAMGLEYLRKMVSFEVQSRALDRVHQKMGDCHAAT